MATCKLIIFCMLPGLLTLALAQLDDPTNIREYTCGGGKVITNGSALEKSLKAVLNTLAVNVAGTGINCSANGDNGDPIHGNVELTGIYCPYDGYNGDAIHGNGDGIYGLAQCRGDLNGSTCGVCASYAKKIIREVCSETAGRIHVDGCFLRYDTYNFFSKLDLLDESSVSRWCDNVKENSTVKNARNLDGRIENLLTRVVENAVSSNLGYSTLNESGFYTLAQCWRDLSMNQCRQCLTAMHNSTGFCPPGTSQENILHGNCMIRYTQYKFYSDGVPLLSLAPGNAHPKTLGLGIGGAVILVLLVGLGIRKRKAKQLPVRSHTEPHGNGLQTDGTKPHADLPQ